MRQVADVKARSIPDRIGSRLNKDIGGVQGKVVWGIIIQLISVDNG